MKNCLKPKHGLFSAHQTLNDELPNRIISGGVIVKANVAEFTETGAIFEDGTKIDNLDAVVLATGYIFGFPFIDKSVIEVKANKVNLYKYIFPLAKTYDGNHRLLPATWCNYANERNAMSPCYKGV
jgi:dimethylaniline monooxygenase (N-oxide forming)